MKEGLSKSFKLFKIFFQMGFFAFGGGYSMIPLIQKEIVENEELIDDSEFLDVISVVEGLPGAIGLNTSIFIGYRVNKVFGALICAVGSVLPSLIIVTIIMALFMEFSTSLVVQQAFNGIRPVVVALILYAAFKISVHAYKYKWYFIITIISFYIALEKIIEIPLLVILGLIVGIVLSTIEEKYRKS